jgi:membrane carboxypeptidase/penicillin-binding protein
MTTAWVGNDKLDRPIGHKDAAFMIAVPMFSRYMWEVTAGQPLQEVPWERPKGVNAKDTGGTLRTTMEEVKEEAEQQKKDAGKGARKVPGRT